MEQSGVPEVCLVQCLHENSRCKLQALSVFISKPYIENHALEGLHAFNPLNAELNPIRHLLSLVGARHIVHVSRIRVKITFKMFATPCC